jgi:hypothetical protein
LNFPDALAGDILINLDSQFIRAAMSVIIVSGTMLIEYNNPWAGMGAVGSISFFLVLYWEVATSLDNPAKAPWFIGRIPGDWL